MEKEKLETFKNVLRYKKPLKGQQNDFQYSQLKQFIPKSANSKEYEYCIKLICDKIKY